MAEDSAVWDGLTTGDAYSITKWNAPYNANRWSDIMDLLLAASYNGGFVLPRYANSLAVIDSSPASMVVHLSTGVAFIRGRLYENTADKSLTIASNASANPRIDRVILTVDFDAHTIRSSILQGTPAAIPALPKLTQTSSLYEISLAYIWVASGAATITDVDIHDERVFASNSLEAQYSSTPTNVIINSEFMGFSQLSGGATTNPPDGWSLEATPSDIDSYTRPSQMIRGRAVQITANAASEGISQTFIVKPSTTYAIKLLTRANSGSEGSITVTTNSAAPATITRNNRRVLAWIEETIFYTTENDATSMTVKLMALANGDVVQYGQVLVVEGYIPGPFQQIRETILFTEAVTDAQWNNTTPATSNQIVVNWDQHFQGLILPETRAVLVYIEFTETSSLTLSSYLTFIGPRIVGSVTTYPLLWATGNSPGTYSTYGWVGTTVNSITTQFTEIGTLTITIKILGIKT